MNEYHFETEICAAHIYAQDAARAVVYVPGGDAAALLPLIGGAGVALAVLDGFDWNACLTPWRAPGAFRGGADFAGGADGFLDGLIGSVIPRAEAALGFAPAFRALAGYSLAGLFALYAATRTDAFPRVASVSGSLWYDGFASHMDAWTPKTLPERAYLSLGDRESAGKNARLASVGAQTERVRARLTALGVPTRFEWERGGHFGDAPARTARGILHLIGG